MYNSWIDLKTHFFNVMKQTKSVGHEISVNEKGNKPEREFKTPIHFTIL